MGLFNSVRKRKSDSLFHKTAAQTAGADLECLWLPVNNGFHRHKVGTEFTLGANADMLTDTTLLLGLSLTGNNLSDLSAFSTNITSTCHSYIHLILNVFNQKVPLTVA